MLIAMQNNRKVGTDKGAVLLDPALRRRVERVLRSYPTH